MTATWARHTLVDWLPKSRRIVRPSFTTSAVDPDFEAERVACEGAIVDLRFDATSLPLDDLAFEARWDGVSISVRMLVPDRDVEDLQWLQVWRTLLLPWAALRMNGPDYLVRIAREIVANTMAHEVDESITLRGVRVFDAHAPLLVKSDTQPGGKNDGS